MKIPMLGLLLTLSLTLWSYESFSEDFVRSGYIYSYVILPEEGAHGLEGQIRLMNESGRVLCLADFFPYQLDDETTVMLAMLGIGPEVDPGIYRLEGECSLSNEEARFSRQVQVVSRPYAEQVVALNRTLTTLRAEPDPRKAEESRLRLMTLREFDPQAVYYDGTISDPVEGDIHISTGYGARRLYNYDDGTESRTLHSGLDWAAPLGTPIHAVAHGRVVLAQEMLVTGNTLIIEHLPGVYSVYYHLDTMNVSKGEMVHQEQLLGTMGETGLATGSHLHWELRVNRSPVDPDRYLAVPLIDKEWIISKISSLQP